MNSVICSYHPLPEYALRLKNLSAYVHTSADQPIVSLVTTLKEQGYSTEEISNAFKEYIGS